MTEKFTSGNILEPWYFTDKGLTNQLEKEINKDHILHGITGQTHLNLNFAE